MKVKAKSMGQYAGQIRNAGDFFDIEDRLFSARWMEKVQVQTPKVEPPAPVHAAKHATPHNHESLTDRKSEGKEKHK